MHRLPTGRVCKAGAHTCLAEAENALRWQAPNICREAIIVSSEET